MDGLKKLFQGKKGKFFIAAIAVVAILGFIAWRKKASGTNTSVVDGYTPTEYTGGGSGGSGSAGSSTPDVTREDVVGLFSSYTSVVQDALKQQAAQNKSLSDSVNSALAYQQSGFNQTIAGINSSLGSLTGTVNDSLLANAQLKLQYNAQQPTYDDSAYGGFNPPAAATGTSNVIPFTSTPTPKATPSQPNTLGFIGETDKANTAADAAFMANPTKETQSAAEKAFVAAAQARDAERARAEKVYNERKAAGKDTSAQEAYLKKLG